jgi:hypothetical protein
MKVSQFLTVFSILTISAAALACPVAKNIIDVSENWEVKLKSRHEQTVLHNDYNFVSSLDSKNQLTTIAIVTSNTIQENDELNVLFNSSEVYREGSTAIDRSAKGVATLNGKLVEVQMVINDKSDQEITLGEFISTINADFKVECKLKEKVQFNTDKPLSSLKNAIQS